MKKQDRELILDALALIRNYHPTCAKHTSRRQKVTAAIEQRLNQKEQTEMNNENTLDDYEKAVYEANNNVEYCESTLLHWRKKHWEACMALGVAKKDLANFKAKQDKEPIIVHGDGWKIEIRKRSDFWLVELFKKNKITEEYILTQTLKEYSLDWPEALKGAMRIWGLK